MRYLISLLAIGILGALPMVTLANSLYFEFNPDFGEGLFLASSRQPVEQVFLPLNDHLSAFDIWASNNNTPGDITFELFDPNDVLISSVTRFINATPDSATGTRFGIVLPAQVSTIANQPYKIRFSSTVPEMRLYYATQRAILSHNAEPQAIYTGGLALIGGDERAFAFKSALYETTESTPPVLSNINATITSVDQVRLTFNATEPVDAHVSYGPQGQSSDGTVSYTGQYTSCAEGIQQCTITLPISHPGTAHDFTLTVRDVWGNLADVSGTFTSAGVSIVPSSTPTPSATPTPLPTPDTTPPIITNARAVNVTHNSAGIAWTTNEATNTLVVVHFGVNQITVGGGSDSTLELEHLIPIANLGQQSTYSATIRSGDASGNESTATFDFTTSPGPTPGPGTPGPSPSPTPTISVGPSSGGGQEAQWSAPDGGVPANGYRIDIIGEDGQLIDSLFTDATSAPLGELPDGARIIVYADHGDGVFEKVAAPHQSKKSTPLMELLLTNLPYILVILGGGVIGGALIWRKLRKQKTPETPEASVPTNPSEHHDFTSGT